MGAVLSREVAKNMPLMLQQYKYVTEFSGAFSPFRAIVYRPWGIGMGMQYVAQ